MMKRTKDERSRVSQYREILLGVGQDPKSCRTLCIVFGDEETARLFHYESMRASWYEFVLIFDACGPAARIVYHMDSMIRDEIVGAARGLADCAVYDE